MNCDEKLNYRFDKKIEDLSMESKITHIKFVSMEKSSCKVIERKLLVKREEMIKIFEIHLI